MTNREVIRVRAKSSKGMAAPTLTWKDSLTRHWEVYVMLLVPLVWLIIFAYVPMGGLVIAFKDYSFKRGILGSRWVGVKYFKTFFNSPLLGQLVGNTLALSVYSLLVGFPLPIVLAIFLNECKIKWMKKSVQTITYFPYFISTVVLVGIIMNFFATNTGFVNKVITMLGGSPVNFTGEARFFRHLYVWSGLWQGAGYSAIIYIAALAGVSPELIEAGIIDGTNRLQKIWYIQLPSILSTIIILLIMAMGGLLSVGYEKVYLLQNPLNLNISEVIATYVYKRGIQETQYSYTTAIGMFNSVVNTLLLVITNFICRKLTDGETSLF